MKQSKSISAAHLIFLLIFLMTTASGQQTGVPSPTQSPSVTPTSASSPVPAATPVPSPKVVGIEGDLELDDIVRVKVENFDDWAEVNDPTKLVPFIDGRAILGNYPEEIHQDSDRLHFHLQITPESKERWTDLLGAPQGARRPVAFTVGLEDKSPFDSVHGENNPIPLTIISRNYAIVAIIVVLGTLILLLWLSKKTNLIREPGESPVPGKLRPYNLGRTQMAFWFFLVFASYTAIWLITDALDTITASLLGLMGISAGTALGEAMIDTSKNDAQSSQLQELGAQKQAMQQSIPELESQLNEVNTNTSNTLEDTSSRDSLNKQLQDARTQLAQVTKQIDDITPSSSAGVSRGFLSDLLSDSTGYSFHRFQIFAWTIILGIMFVSSVYNHLTMPEFSATLLGLMGLSSGTYIGFKFPEQK
jgi:hypothetical protein